MTVAVCPDLSAPAILAAAACPDLAAPATLAVSEAKRGGAETGPAPLARRLRRRVYSMYLPRGV